MTKCHFLPNSLTSIDVVGTHCTVDVKKRQTQRAIVVLTHDVLCCLSRNNTLHDFFHRTAGGRDFEAWYL